MTRGCTGERNVLADHRHGRWISSSQPADHVVGKGRTQVIDHGTKCNAQPCTCGAKPQPEYPFRAHSAEAAQCPDGGRCWHECAAACFRVQHCGPLSGVYLEDQWPEAIKQEQEDVVVFPIIREDKEHHHHWARSIGGWCCQLCGEVVKDLPPTRKVKDGPQA